MSKVLVDRDLLERIASDDEGVASSADFEDLKRVLAQPAEAEGVEVVGVIDEADEGCSVELMHDRTFRLGEKLVRQSDHLVALSAVTAERDKHRSKWARVESERDRLLAEVEALRPDALIGTDAYRATVYVLRRAACDEVFGVAKLQRIFLLDWHSSERLLKEMVRRGDVEQCASHGWKFPDADMAAKEE